MLRQFKAVLKEAGIVLCDRPIFMSLLSLYEVNEALVKDTDSKVILVTHLRNK